MKRSIGIVCFLTLFFLLLISNVPAQTGNSPDGEKPGEREGKKPSTGQGQPMGRPPSPVVTEELSRGMIAPRSEFIGTVFFDELARVASELGGIVDSVLFEEGQKIKKGQDLVILNADLLEKNLLVKQSDYQQALVSLEQAQLDFKRSETLFREKSISEKEYDTDRFLARILEKRADSLKAEVDSTKTELKKKIIHAPFDGIVIERLVETGEWVPAGGDLADIAREDAMDIMVYVPQEILTFIKPGMELPARVLDKAITGRILGIIPRGNIETRTFPVRLRVVEKRANLFQGMEARVTFPTGPERECFTVSRDAVLTQLGSDVIYTVMQGKAVMMPVQVVGFDDMTVGLEGEGLSPGMQVIVKGNERIRSGQAVMPMGARPPGQGKPGPPGPPESAQ